MSRSQGSRQLVVAAAMLVLLAGPLLRSSAGAAAPAPDLGEMPRPANCRPLAGMPSWLPEASGADLVREGVFYCAGTVMLVRAAQYFDQGPGREAINETVRTIPQQWMGRSVAHWQELADGHVMQARVVSLSETDTRTVWSWYGVDGAWAGSDFRAKWLETTAVLMGGRPASVRFIVAFEAPPRGAAADVAAQAARDVWSWYLADRAGANPSGA